MEIVGGEEVGGVEVARVGGEPSFEAAGSEVEVGEGGGLEPAEVEFWLLGGDGRGPAVLVAGPVFDGDVVDEGVFVSGGAALVEEVFFDEEARPDVNAEQAGFFVEFASDGVGDGFAGFDVSAGEVPVASFGVLTEEEVLVVGSPESAGEDADVGGEAVREAGGVGKPGCAVVIGHMVLRVLKAASRGMYTKDDRC